jgi:hypothetical protein
LAEYWRTNSKVSFISANSRKVNTYTEFSRICLRDGHTSLLRIWYWLRHLDRQSSGWISNQTFFECVTELGLTKTRAQQLYQEGLNEWWQPSGDGIYIVGRGPIGEMLGTKEGYTVELPESVFENIQTFRAYIYATWFSEPSWKRIRVEGKKMIPMGGRSISRGKLRELFGISESTQRRYEEIAGIMKSYQFARATVDENNFDEVPFREEFLEGEKCGQWIEFEDGKKILVWQISNRYTVSVTYCRQRSRVKGLTGNGGPKLSGRASHHKLFFDQKKEAEQAITHGKVQEGGIFVKSEESERGVEYEYWTSD